MKIVPYLDGKTLKIAHIPEAELSTDCVEVIVRGREKLGTAWVEHRLNQVPRHPPLTKGLRSLLPAIQRAFAEHVDRTVEQWEMKSRCAANPRRTIDGWLYTSIIYRTYERKFGKTLKARKSLFALVVSCLLNGREGALIAWRVPGLSRPQAQAVVDAYFAKA